MKYIITCLILFITSNSIIAQDNEKLFIVTEPMPSFPGGQEALDLFIKDNLIYPQDALEKGITGTVVAQFAVAPNGEIRNTKIKYGLYHSCDKAVIDLIKSMPKWIPVSKTSLSENLILPINFTLPYRIENGVKIYINPDQLPHFPEGEKGIYKYINKKMKGFIQKGQYSFGRVTVRFIITNEGKIQQAKIVKGLNPTTDKHALDVINSMPDWFPAKHNGEKVNVYFVLPIIYKPQ